ncbi:MAG: hypothetical protein KBC84_09960 [Proteobacteria bacterium]|nr:hypothetical protein [Pseudomonadota bacterium]
MLANCLPATAQEEKAPPKEIKAAKPEPAATPEKAVPSAVTLPTGGEFVCESNIFYSWKLPAKPIPGRPQDPPVEQAEVKEYYTTVGEQALNESEAKEKIKAKISTALGQAKQYCTQIHNGKGSCISDKIKMNNDVYYKADFATRNAIISSLNKDCESLQGTCLETESSEVKCLINKPAVAGTEEKTQGGETNANAEAAKAPAKKK